MSDRDEEMSAAPPAGNEEKQDKPAESQKGSEAKAEPKGGDEAKAEAKGGDEAKAEPKGGDEAKAEAKGGDEAKAEPKGGDEAKPEAKGGDEAKAEAKGGDEAKAEAKEGAPSEASQANAPANKIAIRPASKRALEATRRSARPSAGASATGAGRKNPAVAAQPSKHDFAKAIALVACIVLFLACVGVAVWKWPVIAKRWNRMFGPPREAVHILPEDVKKMVDDMEQADLLYADAAEQAKSEKLEELQEAQRKMNQARDAWGVVNEYGYSYQGFEEKRSHAARMLAATQKEFRDLNEKVWGLEQEVRRARLKAEQQAKAEQPAAVERAATQDGAQLIDEEAFRKMEKDDPSEYERFKKLLDNGKAKFKPKAAGETPANPDTQAKAPEAPAKAEEKPAAKPKEDAARAPEKAPAAPAE